MKKTILLLLFPILLFGQIQQTFQYTGDPNHYPSLNSFFYEKSTSLDKVLENSDFVDGLTVNTPYTYNVIDGDVKIQNSPTPSNINRYYAKLLPSSVNEFLFKKGDIGRTFIVLGYNSPTQICVVILSWSSSSIYGRLINYNLANNTIAQLSNPIVSTHMTTNQSGRVKVTGDTVELYKDDVLTWTYDYPAIAALGGWVNTRNLGVGFHSYGSTGTAVVTNSNTVLFDVALKGETVVEHFPIFASVSNGTISPTDTWSSLQTFNYVNVNLSNLKVAILGDSHSDNSQTIGNCLPSEKWHVLLKNLHNWQVTNKSQSGRSLAEVVGESSGTDLALLNSLDENGTPDVILVPLGTNDFAGDAILLGTPTDTVKNTFWGASNFVFPYLKTRYPNSKIIYITPPQIGLTLYVSNSTMTHNVTGVKFSDYLLAPKTVCAQNSIDVIDFFTFCRELNYQAITQDNTISSDKIHLNGNGNYLQALYIERQLRRILEY